MLTEETLKHIANIFIGDEGKFFPYKSGPVIVSFFNNYLGTTDHYGQGFPSRWVFVYNKLVELLNGNQFDRFLNIAFSASYISSACSCSEVEAHEKAELLLKEIRKYIEADGYLITGNNGSYHLVKKDMDLELLGSGGFANAYFQKSTGNVLKKLKEDYLSNTDIRSRFKREFNITKSLQDIGGIIKVYDFNEDNYSYTMERAEITLEKYITQYDFGYENKVKCIRIILYIMKTVHERNVIHRDLSPNNIFVIHGQLKIADFGLGKDLNMFTSHQTIFTNAVGQYYYCAPEQFMLLRDGDKKSDVYSLGRILNFIMTGDPRESNHIFRSVAEKATSSDAAYRYADAGQMLSFFEKTVAFNQKTDRIATVKDLMQKNIFNESVEEFIYEQNGQEICRWIINKEAGYNRALREFMNIDNEHALHIIQMIDKEYQNVCQSFPSYDPISDFTYSVIGKYSYLVSEIAANILRYIAIDINRFHAQHLIDSLINAGLEPAIEEILKS